MGSLTKGLRQMGTKFFFHDIRYHAHSLKGSGKEGEVHVQGLD